MATSAVYVVIKMPSLFSSFSNGNGESMQLGYFSKHTKNVKNFLPCSTSCFNFRQVSTTSFYGCEVLKKITLISLVTVNLIVEASNLN